MNALFPQRLTYRRDIDGLRSIAVMLVVLAHAGFAWIPGGFVGVDVFFAISGFLITTIIVEAQCTGRFSVDWFLGRRIKRLMPALFLVVAVTAVAFSLVMLPRDLKKLYESVIWVLLYAGNFFFWIEHGGYFGANAQEAPLLHTWSLAVEEQYYMVWPFMLVASLRWLGHRALLVVAALGCVAATVISQWGTEVAIGAVYYLLPTRFFQLLIGSWLAVAWNDLPTPRPAIRSALSFLGMGMIVGSALMFDEHSPFPGYNGLYPVVGAALLIYSRDGIVNRLLDFGVFVAIGQISYSLYLWHWPIFTFIRYVGVELSLGVQIAGIALSMALAFLSWKYVEQPFRKSDLKDFRRIVTRLFLLPATGMIALALAGLAAEGLPGRFPPAVLSMEAAFHSHPDESRAACHATTRGGHRLPSEACSIGVDCDGANAARVFIFGDSHANHLVPFLDVLLSDAGFCGQDYTMDTCLPVFDLEFGRNASLKQACRSRNEQARTHITEHPFDFVVLAGNWAAADDVGELETKLRATLEAIAGTGAIPVLVEDTPSLHGLDPKCPIKREIFDSALECEIASPPNATFSALVARLQLALPSLLVIEPRALLCGQGTDGDGCTIELGGVPLFRDNDHLNEHGSRLLGRSHLERHPNPFARP